MHEASDVLPSLTPAPKPELKKKKGKYAIKKVSKWLRGKGTDKGAATELVSNNEPDLRYCSFCNVKVAPDALAKHVETKRHKSKMEKTHAKLDKIMIRMDQLEIGKMLGTGATGVILAATYFGQQVAVKKLHAHIQQDLEAICAFYGEVQIWSEMSFKNLLQLFGVCLEEGNVIMVMERCDCSMSELLYNKGKHPDLDWKNRLTIAREIASGMYYMHSRDIIHRDLKSMNVLMTATGTAKICDFGMSLHIDKLGDPAAEGGGTPQWLAPEVIRGQPFSKAADVFSFGIVLWELATRSLPHPDRQDNMFDLMDEIADRGLRPGLQNIEFSTGGKENLELEQSYLTLMTHCWHDDPQSRPGFNGIERSLKEMMDKLDGKDYGQLQLAADYREQGIAACSARDFEKSEDLLEQSLAIDKNEDSYGNLWLAQMAQAKFNEALATASEWTVTFPDCIDSWCKRGECLMKQERFVEAMETFERGLKRDPYNTALKRKMKEVRKELKSLGEPNNHEGSPPNSRAPSRSSPHGGFCETRGRNSSFGSTGPGSFFSTFDPPPLPKEAEEDSDPDIPPPPARDSLGPPGEDDVPDLPPKKVADILPRFHRAAAFRPPSVAINMDDDILKILESMNVSTSLVASPASQPNFASPAPQPHFSATTPSHLGVTAPSQRKRTLSPLPTISPAIPYHQPAFAYPTNAIISHHQVPAFASPTNASPPLVPLSSSSPPSSTRVLLLSPTSSTEPMSPEQLTPTVQRVLVPERTSSSPKTGRGPPSRAPPSRPPPPSGRPPPPPSPS